MNRISFDTVINFYPEHNAWAYGQLLSAMQDTATVVPFVGAGLSAFCGYPSWPNVLSKMCGNIRDDSKREQVRMQIESGELIEAAQEIQNGYRFFLRRLPEEFSPKRLDDCPDAAMRSSAAWMLPYLFPEAPAVTTNFDQVLETVYERSQHRFSDILGPQQLCQRAQSRQQRHHSLLKLHGSIGKTIDHNAIVFTKKQYDDAYLPDSRLVLELTELFQNDTLLFLGCSLQMDRTLKVLEKLQPDGSYLTHFAILGCAPEKFDERCEQLETLGIIPIFYDNADPRNHDSVRVILEHLLYETNPDAYQRLDDEMRRFVGPVKRDDVLMYNAGRIKYTGRTAELSALERFCSSPVTNEWWAVTGPGGMGKSRLIYEFTNQKQKDGWQILWFNRDQYDRLTSLRLPAKNTIVVLDDVQADIQSAGEWLKIMRTYRRINRLRILLIERDGLDYDHADWLRALRSGNPYTDPLVSWCHSREFLHLEPLTDEDLNAIMSSCAEALGKTIAPEPLLTALDRVDRELRRPLYALALAEAACNGDDPLRWDPDRVLDEMLDRELTFHYECLQYTLKEQPTASLQEELELLMAQCCIHGHLPLTAVSVEKYPYLSGCMGRRSPAEFFRCLGLLHLNDDTPVLRMNCPDLIREHLVLRLAFEYKTLDLLPDGWHKEPERFLFLYRLWLNHPDRLTDQPAFWDRFFSVPPTESILDQIYVDLLWGCTEIFPPLAQRAVDTLDIRYNSAPDSEHTAVCLAHGLFNLTCYQKPLHDCTNILPRLESLYNAHRDNQEIILIYATGLVNLTTIHDSIQDCTDTVHRLEDLYDAHRDNQDIAVRYANGLCNLSYFQKVPKEIVDTVRRLETLCEAYRDKVSIAHKYAGALVNFALAQTEEPPVREILLQSESLLKEHPEDPVIQLCHTMTWFNLTLVQPELDITATVSDIADFLHAHPAAISEFLESLDDYLSEYPEHKDRYLPLKNLGGDSHA